MFVLPSLAGIPLALTTGGGERLFAQMAVEAWPRKDKAVPPLVLQYAPADARIERHALEWRLREALEPAMEELKVFNVTLNVHADHDDVWIHLRNRTEEYIDSSWVLEARWKSLEARAPGLAASALDVLMHAAQHALPLYTPSLALHYCDYVHWRGCGDEQEVLHEIIEFDEEIPAGQITAEDIRRVANERGMLLRSDVDKTLPRFVQSPKSLTAKQLGALCARRGEIGEIAAAVLHLRRATTRACRRKEEPGFESMDSDTILAFGFGAALRWTIRDPMLRFFDDYAQMESESSMAIEPSFGWYGYQPGQLPAILTSVLTRLQLAREIEKILPMLATRQA